MSYVDQPERPSRSISERFQYVWDHPTPLSLLAQIKGLVNLPQTIRDMVDASRIVTGPAPTTEEEAYIFNQAREYVPRAGFEVASAASPSVPKVAGRLPVRPTGGSTLRAEGPSQTTNGVLSSDVRRARPEPYAQPPAALRPGAGEGGGSGVLGGWSSSPAELPWWMQALLPPGAMPVGPLPVGAVARQALPPTAFGANRSLGIPYVLAGKPIPEMPPPRPPFASGASGGGRLPPSIVGLAGLPAEADPNHRELRRVDANSRGVVQSGDEGNGKPLGIQSPPLVPDQEPPALDEDTGGAGSGGTGGNTGTGGNDAERKQECNQRWQDERDNYCPQFRPAGVQFEKMCQDVAAVRLKHCYRNEPEREKFSWRDVELEDRLAYLKWARAEAKRRKKKPGKRR